MYVVQVVWKGVEVVDEGPGVFEGLGVAGKRVLIWVEVLGLGCVVM